MKPALIFDLDGTLLDTLDDIGSACNAALEASGLSTHPLQAYRQMVGNGFSVLVKRAVGESPGQINLREITDNARRIYAENMMIRTKPYPGLTRTLATLASQGVAMAVFSNKPDKLCEPLIRHYFPEIPFSIIQGSRDGLPLKPEPDALLDILRRLNATKVFYIGDSDVDMQTAINAGVPGIGAAWGFRGKKELEEAGAWRILEHPGELAILSD